jgi:hypothetical protein
MTVSHGLRKILTEGNEGNKDMSQEILTDEK